MDIHWRFDRLIQAQRGAGPYMGLKEETAYFLMAAFLNDTDLAAIRPYLIARDPELPALGEEGVYRGVVVFSADSPQRAEFPPKYAFTPCLRTRDQ